MTLLRRLLDKMYKAGARVFAPAKDDDVRLLRLTLARHKLPTLPNDFVQFLNLTDGLMYNGLRFFGVHSHPRDMQAYTYPSLLEINLDYIARQRGMDVLIVGEKDEDLIVYSAKEKVYQLIDRMDLTPELNLPRFFDVIYLFSEDLVKEEPKEQP